MRIVSNCEKINIHNKIYHLDLKLNKETSIWYNFLFNLFTDLFDIFTAFF